jgi:hypothetical protein
VGLTYPHQGNPSVSVSGGGTNLGLQAAVYGTAAEWTAANPVLGKGELGHETDTGVFKVGDGSTAWASLLSTNQASREDPVAAGLGYINWTWNPAIGGSATALTSQRIDVAAIYLPPNVSVSNIYLNVIVAGTSTAPTGFFVGLASATKMLAQSANLAASASLTATGAKAFALSGSYTTSLTDSANGLYYVVLLQNGAFGGTNVTFHRGNASTSGFALSYPIFGNVGTSQTALPANGAAVTISAAAGLGWFAAAA